MGPKAMIQMGGGPGTGRKAGPPGPRRSPSCRLYAGYCLLSLSWTSSSGVLREEPCVHTWDGAGATVARPAVTRSSLGAALPSLPVLEVCAFHGGWMFLFPGSLHCPSLAAPQGTVEKTTSVWAM